MHGNIKNILVIGILAILFLGVPIFATIWEDCPFYISEEYHSGLSKRYLDSNTDSICDRFQLESTVFLDQRSFIEPTTSDIAGVPVLQNSSITNLIISFILVIAGLLLTRTLSKRNIISKTKERLLWNILLLIFFLPSAITGVIIILTPSFPNLRDIGVLTLDLHGLTSYYFMWISGYHIVVHIKFFSKELKSLSKK